MKFHHLIQVNDPREPSIEPLTRTQLWQGLVTRAEKPSYFLLGLDECAILSRGENTLRRKLRFGSLIVHDCVRFEPPVRVSYETEASADTPAGSLVMSIEEPVATELFVRFEYELRNGSSAAEKYYDAFRKSAYVEADIDTIRMIRQMAVSGLFDLG